MCTCFASSLVGASRATNGWRPCARRPFAGNGFSALIASTMGNTNANVLPHPVLALPTKSLPSSTVWNVMAWMPYNVLKPLFCSFSLTSGESAKLERCIGSFVGSVSSSTSDATNGSSDSSPSLVSVGGVFGTIGVSESESESDSELELEGDESSDSDELDSESSESDLSESGTLVFFFFFIFAAAAAAAAAAASSSAFFLACLEDFPAFAISFFVSTALRLRLPGCFMYVSSKAMLALVVFLVVPI